MHVHTWLGTHVEVGRQLEGLFFPSTMCVLGNIGGGQVIRFRDKHLPAKSSPQLQPGIYQEFLDHGPVFN